MNKPIRTHPDNKKYFEYKGESVVLLCATEHYGSVINRPFDYKSYLEYCLETGQNYTRIFLLFRELQTPVNPYSTCKPESPDFISPYMRTGPGNAADGLKKYDLDKWNPEFFNRLHSFMQMAEKCGVTVEITLFSNPYSNELLSLLPFGADSNINGVWDRKFECFMSIENDTLFEYQKKYVRKIITELNQYTNFFFEICNEPISFSPELVSINDVNNWQQSLIDYIRFLESDLKNKHMIAVTECWKFYDSKNIEVGTDESFNVLSADIVNVHPLENIIYKGESFDLGLFMSKKLNLAALRDFCLKTWHEEKPLSIDEDNIASRFKDYDGWTIHRKRAWASIMSGAHYDYIDFSIMNYCPKGTSESQEFLHRWFSNIRYFIKDIDFINGCPLPEAASVDSIEILECVYGTEGVCYNIYLANIKEIDEEGYGDEVNSVIELNIEKGSYNVIFYSPEIGTEIKDIINIEYTYSLKLPPFKHDLAIRLIRM